jgi:histidine triad (HIT) family protein
MCLFCKIVRREVSADVILEDDEVLAFKDVRPAAPSHALVIPKKHITSIHEAEAEDGALLGRMMLAAQQVAEKLGLGPSGYRLVVNTGRDAGQSVFHLHVHVLGGRALAWPPG